MRDQKTETEKKEKEKEKERVRGGKSQSQHFSFVYRTSLLSSQAGSRRQSHHAA
jgi:hypothetical protein